MLASATLERSTSPGITAHQPIDYTQVAHASNSQLEPKSPDSEISPDQIKRSAHFKQYTIMPKLENTLGKFGSYGKKMQVRLFVHNAEKFIADENNVQQMHASYIKENTPSGHVAFDPWLQYAGETKKERNRWYGPQNRGLHHEPLCLPVEEGGAGWGSKFPSLYEAHLASDEFTKHGILAGMPGSGKSTSVDWLLKEAFPGEKMTLLETNMGLRNPETGENELHTLLTKALASGKPAVAMIMLRKVQESIPEILNRATNPGPDQGRTVDVVSNAEHSRNSILNTFEEITRVANTDPKLLQFGVVRNTGKDKKMTLEIKTALAVLEDYKQHLVDGQLWDGTLDDKGLPNITEDQLKKRFMQLTREAIVQARINGTPYAQELIDRTLNPSA
jgi:hypothetical protein